MLRASIERQFDLWRRRGDATALGKVFDRTAPELWRLATHLVRDPAEAEDVLQATYLVAIERAQVWDRDRPLIPWLVGILVNQARLARKRSRTSAERSAPLLDPPGPGADPSEHAAAEEFSVALAAALDKLPQPYREVLRMHLAEGRRPVEIARELGRPPGTVRMQMSRGMKLLQRALPPGFAAGAALSVFPTRGLAAVRTDVLARGAEAAVTLAGGATGAGAGGGLASLGLKLAVAGVAVTAIGVWFARPGARDERDPSDPSDVPEVAVQPAAEPAHLGEQVAVAGRSLGRRSDRSTAAAPASAAHARRLLLRGRVVGPRPDELPDVRLEVRGIARFTWPEDSVSAGAPAGDGTFALDVTELVRAAEGRLPLHGLVVSADHPRYLPAEADAAIGPDGPAHDVALKLTPAGVISGRLQLPPDRPLVRLAALRLVAGEPVTPPVAEATCGPGGSFELRVGDGAVHAVVAVSDGYRPLTQLASAAPGTLRELVSAPLATGALLEGRVLNAGGPAEGVPLLIVSGVPGRAVRVLEHDLLWVEGRFEPRSARLVTGPGGGFALPGLAPGPYGLTPLGLDRDTPQLKGSARPYGVTAPASGVLIELELARVRLELERADGSPASGRATLTQGARALAIDVGASGTCSFAVAPFGACRVGVQGGLWLPARFELDAPGPGETHVERVVLEPAPSRSGLVIALSVPAGIELGHVVFELHPLGADERPAAEPLLRRASIEGGLVRAEAPPGSYGVGLFAGGHYEHYTALLQPVRFDARLAPGGERALEIALALGGRLRLHVTDPDGGFLAASCVVRDAAGEELGVRFLCWRPERVHNRAGRLWAMGPNDVYPNLAPGDYEIELSAPGRETTTARAHVEAGAATDVHVELELAR